MVTPGPSVVTRGPSLVTRGPSVVTRDPSVVTRGHPWSLVVHSCVLLEQIDENGLATNDAVVGEAIEQNNNEQEEQPRDTDNNERPQRERRPPDWFVHYHIDF